MCRRVGRWDAEGWVDGGVDDRENRVGCMNGRVGGLCGGWWAGRKCWNLIKWRMSWPPNPLGQTTVNTHCQEHEGMVRNLRVEAKSFP